MEEIMKESVLEAALKYIKFGWYVIPLWGIRDGRCACPNPDCPEKNWGKHPRTANGLNDASNDEKQVTEWFSNGFGFSIGIYCEKSGICVLDVDPRNGGDVSLAQLTSVYGELPTTVMANTGGGGVHYIFQFHKDFNLPKGFSGGGLDIRKNAYIVVAPSVHKSGKEYEWVFGQSPWELLPTAVPDFLIATKSPNIVFDQEGKAKEDLEKLSGKPEIKGDVYSFRPNQNGTLQIVVDGKSTGAWIDTNGYIGSHSKGGPTIIQWICWYGHGVAEAYKIAEKYSLSVVTVQAEVDTNATCNDFEEPVFEFRGKTKNEDKRPPHIKTAEEILNKVKLIFCANNFYFYERGYYKKIEKPELAKYISKILGDDFTTRIFNETISYLEAKTYFKIESLNNADYLNVKNGLLDLKSFQIIPHSPSIYSTIQLPINYTPASQCPKWLKTLDEIFIGDSQKIRILQEFLGLCFTRLTKYEKALFLIGEGANGKSVILYVLQQMLGQGNYSVIPLEKFDAGAYVVNLFGKLANISIETNAKSSVYDSTFKAIVSGDEIIADAKFDPTINFRPFCKLIFALNNMPRVDDKTSAFYRRLLIVRFPRVFASEDQNKNLKHELLEEVDGIFNWFLEGLKRLESRGDFESSLEMQQEVEEYRKENNNVLVFVDEKCRLNSQEVFPKDELYLHYSKWCDDNGNIPLQKIKFGKELRKHFPVITDGGREAGFRIWRGIRYFVSL